MFIFLGGRTFVFRLKYIYTRRSFEIVIGVLLSVSPFAHLNKIRSENV